MTVEPARPPRIASKIFWGSTPHIKDLKNVVDAASAVDAPIPLTQAVLEMMKVLHKDGCGACDHSALLKYYQKLTGEVLHH